MATSFLLLPSAHVAISLSTSRSRGFTGPALADRPACVCSAVTMASSSFPGVAIFRCAPAHLNSCSCRLLPGVWRSKRKSQQPTYLDPEALDSVLAELRRLTSFGFRW